MPSAIKQKRTGADRAESMAMHLSSIGALKKGGKQNMKNGKGRRRSGSIGYSLG
jgi:hypothetical protein